MAENQTTPEKKKLTTVGVQGLKEPGYVWDTELPGFCIRVNPGGSKIYLARYRNEFGQQRWQRVGKHPSNTSENARAQARIVLGESAKGLDPSAERDRRREAIKVEDLVKKFREDYLPKKAAATIANYNNQLDRFILPAIGTKAGRGSRSHSSRHREAHARAPVGGGAWTHGGGPHNQRGWGRPLVASHGIGDQESLEALAPARSRCALGTHFTPLA